MGMIPYPPLIVPKEAGGARLFLFRCLELGTRKVEGVGDMEMPAPGLNTMVVSVVTVPRVVVIAVPRVVVV